jgi:hypothetical protein
LGVMTALDWHSFKLDAQLQARLHQKDGGATLVVGLEEDD